MAPKYILSYFGIPGRAEPIRLMFHAAGVEFTDKRLSPEEWQTIKTDEKQFPLSQMPTLQVDGNILCQSNAICRYVAREHGFYGDSNCDQAAIDQVCETVNDIISGVIPIMFGIKDEEEKKAKFAEFLDSDKIKKQWTFISNMLKNNNGGSGFIVKDKLSLADISVYCIGLLLEGGNPEYLKGFPELISLRERVTSVESIKKYLDSQKK